MIMAAATKRYRSPVFLIFVAFFIHQQRPSYAYQFYVGGRAGWVVNPPEEYNHWAGRMRFQVNDTLFFKYEKGSNSVLEVNRDDYNQCNTNNPILKLEDGNSVFKYDRSGPFYFISGNKTLCDQGQKIITVVLAIRPPPPAPVSPTPAGQPPSPAPASPSPSPSPSPSTSTSPVPAPSSHAPAHTPASSPAPAISVSPANSPSPAAAATPPGASSPETSPISSSPPVPSSGESPPSPPGSSGSSSSSSPPSATPNGSGNGNTPSGNSNSSSARPEFTPLTVLTTSAVSLVFVATLGAPIF